MLTFRMISIFFQEKKPITLQLKSSMTFWLISQHIKEALRGVIRKEFQSTVQS